MVDNPSKTLIALQRMKGKLVVQLQLFYSSAHVEMQSCNAGYFCVCPSIASDGDTLGKGAGNVVTCSENIKNVSMSIVELGLG